MQTENEQGLLRRSDALTLEEIQASTDLSGKIASASALKLLDLLYKTFREGGWILNTDLNNYTLSGIYFMGNGIANGINESLWSPVLVLGNDSTVRQIIFCYTGNKIYVRGLHGGIWTDWTAVN